MVVNDRPRDGKHELPYLCYCMIDFSNDVWLLAAVPSIDQLEMLQFVRGRTTVECCV